MVTYVWARYLFNRVWWQVWSCVDFKPTITIIRFPEKWWHTFTNRCHHVFFCSARREPGALALVEHSGGRTPGAEQWLFGHMRKVFSGLINVKLKGWARFLHGGNNPAVCYGNTLTWLAEVEYVKCCGFHIFNIMLNQWIWLKRIIAHIWSFYNKIICFLAMCFLTINGSFSNYSAKGSHIQKNEVQIYFEIMLISKINI